MQKVPGQAKVRRILRLDTPIKTFLRLTFLEFLRNLIDKHNPDVLYVIKMGLFAMQIQ